MRISASCDQSCSVPHVPYDCQSSTCHMAVCILPCVVTPMPLIYRVVMLRSTCILSTPMPLICRVVMLLSTCILSGVVECSRTCTDQLRDGDDTVKLGGSPTVRMCKCAIGVDRWRCRSYHTHGPLSLVFRAVSTMYTVWGT